MCFVAHGMSGKSQIQHVFRKLALHPKVQPKVQLWKQAHTSKPPQAVEAMSVFKGFGVKYIILLGPHAKQTCSVANTGQKKLPEKTKRAKQILAGNGGVKLQALQIQAYVAWLGLFSKTTASLPVKTAACPNYAACALGSRFHSFSPSGPTKPRRCAP